MPRDTSLRKVMVIGSGPIIIGQAAEFDYAGTQACQVLKEEGIEVVLVNPNPATIMTDPETADRVYLEPLTPEDVAAILRRERPDGLLGTLGGQIGLNLSRALARSGVLAEVGTRLLGTPLEAIERAEDRELFRNLMTELGQPIPPSRTVTNLDEARQFKREIGLPLIVRPAYTLGGTGGGIAWTDEEFDSVVQGGLNASPIGQVLVERSLLGMKEIEYEVLRDAADNAIVVCNMENFDPVGVHTGDSIVVAPSQTLSDRDHQRLRNAALSVIRALGIEGGCNIQFALDPKSDDYYVIEVNPRVSRSSALASKATGYPIARVSARVAVGYRLDEIPNQVTGTTLASFEPALDYVAVKLPRFPFDKFGSASRLLGTQMKATGEVLAIARSFEAALLKAVRSVETGPLALASGVLESLSDEALEAAVRRPSDERLFALAAAIRRGWPVERLAEWTGIDRWFLDRLADVIEMERRLVEQTHLAREGPSARFSLSAGEWLSAKRAGLSDERLARLLGTDSEAVRTEREALGVRPAFHMVDTCAGEFDAQTPYFYSDYGGRSEVEPDPRPSVLVVGAGPIRIGQGIEFDYAAVHAALAVRRAGYRAIMVNNNPETVSTDYATCDRLYFEPLRAEEVRNVADVERPVGVLVQFGGQTAISLARPLADAGLPLLGTPVEAIEASEDRGQFDAICARLGIPRPAGRAVTSLAEAERVAEQVGYPVIVRPSFVLGGRAMQVVESRAQLARYWGEALAAAEGKPVLVDQYLAGVEAEVDALADGRDCLVAGIMEHVEPAGVHSGDSVAIYPAPSIGPGARRAIIEIMRALSAELGLRGLLNAQFVVRGEAVHLLEVNPRASRTAPFLTRATGLPLVRLAVEVQLGRRLSELLPASALGSLGGEWPRPPHVAVKLPVFSFAKLPGVETALGPEMKSTGEVMAFGRTVQEALSRGFRAAGLTWPTGGERAVLLTVADRDKPAAVSIARRLSESGIGIWATPGTARALALAGVSVRPVRKISQTDGDAPGILDLIRRGGVGLVVNTVSRGHEPERDGFRIRRAAVERGIPCLTSLRTAEAALAWLAETESGTSEPRSLQEWQAGLPGLAGLAGVGQR